MAKRKTLAQWIAEAIVDPDKEKPFSALSLCHMQGSTRVEIHSYKHGPTAQIDPVFMANSFQGKAEAYSQDLPGLQTFNLLAFYGKNEPEAFQPFVCNGQLGLEHSGLATESPNEQGRTQQTMRHKEMDHQQVYRKQEHLDNYALSLLRFAEARADADNRRMSALVHENAEAYSIVRDLLNERISNEHKNRMEQLAFSRSTDERKKWLSFAPVLINTILGTEVFPQSTEDTALIEGIAENLTESHLMKLAGIGLPNELMGPLAMRVSKVMEKKKEREEAAKRLPAYRGNVEDDVAGGAE